MKIRVFAVAFAAALIMSAGFAEIASAQPGGRGRGFFGGFDSGYLGLLRNDAIMDEIELVDDQREELQMIQDEMRQEMRERWEEMRNSDMSREEMREMFTELREEMEDRQGDLQKQVEKVLLPGQIKRLKQLEVQNNARRNGRGGMMGALANDSMLEELGIDEKQKKKLEEKAAELKKKLEEKIRKMTTDAEEELLSVLSSEQRKKFMEKYGPTYEFGSDFDRRGRRGGRDRGERERRDNDF